MDRATARIECLKLAVVRRAGGDTPAALVAAAREFEAYVLEPTDEAAELAARVADFEKKVLSDNPAEAGPGRSRESSAAEAGDTARKGSGESRATRPVNQGGRVSAPS